MSDDADIKAWLSEMGLETYLSAFVENDIDIGVLPDLTKEDLKEIGVTSVGHRRKLLAGIEALSASSSKTVSQTAASETVSAERRIVTVMFCDLVDSVGLSSVSDAEDFREFIAHFRQDLETAIRPFGGTISQFMGDGVMASFGYPRASGHDAERAVAAGLAVIDKVKRLPEFAGRQAQVRVGIATGLTVVGSFDVDVSLRDESAIGDTPNLASRLQSLAEPDTMLISTQTRNLVGEIFDCEEMDAAHIKGFTKPLRRWKVLGRGSTLSRHEALRTKRRSRAFVGRAQELAELEIQFDQMRKGSCPLYVVEGETGIGKSRLIAHALSSTQPAIYEPLVMQCSPYSVGVQFYAVRYFVAQAVGFLEGDGYKRVETWLNSLGISGEEANALIINLLDVKSDVHAALSDYSSEQIRARTLDLLIEILAIEAAKVHALVIEDIQWVDPSTVELLERLLPRLKASGVIVLASSHPDRGADWATALAPSFMSLRRIPSEDLRDLVKTIAGDVFLNEDVIDAITERSDGVPIFAEEIAIGYLEKKADSSELDDGLTQVPLSLTESLLERVDRLVNGKRIASTAAALGREFPVAILEAVSELPASVVQTGISELLDAGVFEPGRSLFGEAIRFRHGLVCDAAYELLLRRQRKGLHLQIAQTLSESFQPIVDARPHIAAYHWNKADVPIKAIELWARAGQLANNRSAHSEALGHLEHAAKVNETTPPGLERDKRALELSLNIITERICLRGFQEADVSETEALAELSKKVDRVENLIPALHLKWVHLITSDQAKPACDFAYQVREAGTAKTEAEQLIVLRMCATSQLFCGDLNGSLVEYHAFMELYDPLEHAEEMRKGHSDHAAMVMMGLAEAYVLKGDLEQSRHWGQRSINMARVTNRQHDRAHTLTFSGCLHPYLAREYDVAEAHAHELRGLLDENPLANWEGFPDLFTGLVRFHRGEVEEGLHQAETGALALLESKRYGNWWQVLFAEACILGAHWNKAQDMLDKANLSMAQSELRFGAEYFRLKAKLQAVRSKDHDGAEAALKEGLALARKQAAHLFEQRILEDMAALGKLYA